MKFSGILLTASAILTSLAAPQQEPKSRPFRLKSANSWDPVNGYYLGNKDNAGVLSKDSSVQVVEAYFAYDGANTLFVNGLDGTSDTTFLIPTSPGSNVSTIAFGDMAIPESRWTEWAIRDGKLTYGKAPDRFWAFPDNAGGWTIVWLDPGAITTANGFPVDLLAEYY